MEDTRTALPTSAMRMIMEKFGLDMKDENFEGTPKRFLQYLYSYCQPYDPEVHLGKKFRDRQGDVFAHSMVVQTGIPYHAVCAHHLLPVLGTAHVGYIPRVYVVGLSKLTRLVHGISHSSPSLQEHVGHSVVDALWKHLNPMGAICVIEAEHGCMSARGVEAPTDQIRTVTSSLRGVFAEKAEARQEFFSLIKM